LHLLLVFHVHWLVKIYTTSASCMNNIYCCCIGLYCIDDSLLTRCSVLFFSRPRSEGWPHHGPTFSICSCPLSFWLTLQRRVLSTSWCCPSRPGVAFLACVHLALFLVLSLSPGNSLVFLWLASLLWQCLTVPLYSSFVKNPLICFFAVHETRRIFLCPFISKASRRVSSFFLSVQLSQPYVDQMSSQKLVVTLMVNIVCRVVLHYAGMLP